LPLRDIPDSVQHGRGRAQHQARTDRGRPLLPLERVGAVARRDGALHAAVHHDGRAAGDRTRTCRHGGGGILPELNWSWPDHQDGLANLRYRGRVRGDPHHRSDRRGTHARWALHRGSLRAVAALAMAELAVRPIEIGAARARRRAPGAAVLRLAAGLVILLIWQGVVGAPAPAYVPKPHGGV